ncbi:zinc-binding dehydrogenase [soil metagenome]
MKAAIVRQPGPADSIEFCDIPTPEPVGTQVLVRTGAVSVNPVDTYVRAGAMPWELPSPFVVGCDIAGTVEAVGDEVARLRPGDRVWGSNQGLLGRQGTFAEFACIDEDWLYPTPANVDDEVAAAAALVGITAHLGLVGRAGLTSGETLFVVGGTGGVGSIVVQMAVALGARVACCCGSEEKCEQARALGAELAINYHEAPLGESIKWFAPGGVDVFWETRRQPDFDLVADALAPRGRMILMAGREARPEFPVGPFYFKQLNLYGLVMFNCEAYEQRACAGALNDWLSSGDIRPLVGRQLPLSATAEAHSLQEAATVRCEGGLTGKIVLRPD